MSRAAPTHQAIFNLLAYCPDGLAEDEIAAELAKKPAGVQTSIWYERNKKSSQNLRVRTYLRLQGRGGRAKAVYALGPGPDGRRPGSSDNKYRRERNARYRDRYRAVILASMWVRRGSKTADNPLWQLIK